MNELQEMKDLLIIYKGRKSQRDIEIIENNIKRLEKQNERLRTKKSKSKKAE